MKSYTFLEFLELKFLKEENGASCGVQKIEVPRLQRDYAHGRRSKNCENVAKAFLNALFDTLEEKEKELHLDLIYGYQDKRVFKLIDGQQRVTTLWLLHFFLYKKSQRIDEIKDKLARFVYNMRGSSKDFCKELLEMEEKFQPEKKPSQTIFLVGATSGDRGDDPTVQAMVHMLDLIHEKLNGKDTESFIKRLKCISFNVIDMKDFGLGEDLYIKMNARGRPLLKCEKLKAFIEDEEGKDIKDGTKNSRNKISRKILSAIDNQWSDYFFVASDPDDFDDDFDERFFNFLHYANVFFALKEEFTLKKELEEGSKKSVEDIALLLSTERAIDQTYRFLKNKENLEKLDEAITQLPKWTSLKNLKIKGPEFFGKRKRKEYKEDEEDREEMEEGKQGKLGRKGICHFFAFLFLFEVRGQCVDTAVVEDYLRVCQHFIENHDWNNARDIKSFFRLLKEISQGIIACAVEKGKENEFYEFLSCFEELESEFNGEVYALEKRKAKLIYNDGVYDEKAQG
ncbi:DUF262 domain-containing protein [Helicobacter labacensis]|uniref:DUF262 domain-containing protein n=1 Tax=Helicobacter labacensis TaxID=2316079 RepID=UPI001F37670D|nr:DUF262 domain-containing protein [Helicobacter labacensis]